METLFTILTIHEVKPPVTGEFPHELSIMRRIDVFCNTILLNKQSSYWWYQPHDANASSLWGKITIYLSQHFQKRPRPTLLHAVCNFL